MPRFDEIELASDPMWREDASAVPASVEEGEPDTRSPLFNRLLAVLTDLSLFAALGLALSPLLPAGNRTLEAIGLAGFVAIVSYYYFAGMWLLWGPTIGGVIFGVRVVAQERPAMALRDATLRWAGLLLSLATGGIGFLLAILPSRLSLSDRMSQTHCIAA